MFRDRLSARRRDWLLLAYWLFVPLAVFFLARSRLQLYILPLFVPLALIMSRPIAGWPWFAGRRLAWTLGLTAAALVAIKGSLAYWPSNRDARGIAAQLTRILDRHDVDEIVFVGMRPFYGLNLYLDKHIEGIQIDEKRFEYSKFVALDDVCDELGERERNVYGIKQQHAPRFVAAVRACGAHARLVGTLHADDNDIAFFTVAPSGDGGAR